MIVMLRMRIGLALLLIGPLILLAVGWSAAQPCPLPFRQGSATAKVVALTFDDGPHPNITPQLLKVLAEHEVKATFFVLGSQGEAYPALLQAINAGGHEIGNHGYSHQLADRLLPAVRQYEWERTAQVIVAAGAAKPVLYRPPGGVYTDTMLSELQQQGYRTVMWSVDPRDWAGRPATAIVSSVTAEVRPGAIVLLHEGVFAAHTPAAVATIIERLQADGYRFVTIGELMAAAQAGH